MNLADSPLQHAARWRAVTTRDVAADGAFVYAVKTTGVFCRPTCPSRRPKAENVLFFDGAAAAARAGFRACLRCHPERAVSPRDDAMDRIRAVDPRDRSGGLAADACRTRGRRGLEPLSLPAPLQALGGRLAARVLRRPPARPPAARARCGGVGGRRGLRRRVRLSEPRVRARAGPPRDVAGDVPQRRRRAAHRPRVRTVVARLGRHRRDRARRLRHRDRSDARRGRTDARDPLSAGHAGGGRRRARALARRCGRVRRAPARGRWTCRSTSAAPRSSSACGARFRRPRPARR